MRENALSKSIPKEVPAPYTTYKISPKASITSVKSLSLIASLSSPTSSSIRLTRKSTNFLSSNTSV